METLIKEVPLMICREEVNENAVVLDHRHTKHTT